jgi:adenine deaminase
VRGLSRACEEARPHGVDAALLLSFLRHLDEKAAFETLEQALPFRDRFIGVGLDSGERGNPPEKFARVFARCRALGLHAVAHAGEEGPPSYIRGALDALGAERIDHGVACLQDPALVTRLREERIPITVCPLSNVRLRVVDTLADHPVGRMLEAGLNVSLASDDPAYFGGYVDRNYVDTFAALGLDGGAAYRMARNGLESAFVGAEEKRRLVERLDAYAASFR